MRLLWLLLAESLGSARSYFTPPSGVQYNTQDSFLKANGMVQCYNVPYNYPTYESSFSSCGDSSWVFVGAKFENSDSSFLVGAFGLASDVFRYTNSLQTAYESNGVYWYKVQYYAFGFAATSSIALAHADIATSNAVSRLSWHYNSNNYGGWRAGYYDYLNSNGNFRKVIYKLPLGAGAPTVAPTPSLPHCSVANPQYLGDGYCDITGGYNTAVCDYDRGDCCASTCVSGSYACGIVGYSCKDPGTKAPSVAPTSQPTHTPPTASPTARPSVTPTNTRSPTLQPTETPTTPTVEPSAQPSPAPSTAEPTVAPSMRPTNVPTKYVRSEYVQTFHFDSPRPYENSRDIYESFQFPNMTSYDEGNLYYTTISFSENTKLRKGLDFITIYADDRYLDVYGESQYTGNSFPGMNGQAALGFRAFRFIARFHAGAGEVPDDYGYLMDIQIKRYSSISDVPEDSTSSKNIEVQRSYFGVTYEGMIAMFSVVVVVATLSCCCWCFWYMRSISSAKVAVDEEVFELRLQEHKEALNRTRSVVSTCCILPNNISFSLQLIGRLRRVRSRSLIKTTTEKW